MQQDTYRTISALLASTDPAEIHRGLTLVKAQLPALSEEEALPLLDMVVALFYIDPLDLPEHLPVLEEAITVAAGFGTWAIPVLIQDMATGDVKAQMALAQALGHMGADAIARWSRNITTAPRPAAARSCSMRWARSSRRRSSWPCPLALEAAGAADQELRDSATARHRQICRIDPAGGLSAEPGCDALVERLRIEPRRRQPRHPREGRAQPGQAGEIRPPDRRAARAAQVTLSGILGEDEHFEWDRAYVVRKEAKEALGYVEVI